MYGETVPDHKFFFVDNRNVISKDISFQLVYQSQYDKALFMKGIIIALDNRVKTMNHDVERIDTIVSNALGLKPDTDRIARADGKTDARRD